MTKQMDVCRFGENYVADFLVQNNFKILEKNYHSRYGEIDIIAYDDKYLIFVEVKTRTGTSWGLPREAVSYKKQEKIIKTAEIYYMDCDLDIQPRFDVAEVIIKKNNTNGEYKLLKFEYIDNAFIL